MDSEFPRKMSENDSAIHAQMPQRLRAWGACSRDDPDPKFSLANNIEASRSTIEDADFAAEAADLAKNQILAQSATAMLAQASAIPQNILSLLR